MLTLGDSTLAALIQSDDFLPSQSSREPLKEASPNLPQPSRTSKPTPQASKSKENTSLEAYFNESLVLSRSRYTQCTQKPPLTPPRSSKRKKTSRNPSPSIEASNNVINTSSSPQKPAIPSRDEPQGEADLQISNPSSSRQEGQPLTSRTPSKTLTILKNPKFPLRARNLQKNPTIPSGSSPDLSKSSSARRQEHLQALHKPSASSSRGDAPKKPKNPGIKPESSSSSSSRRQGDLTVPQKPSSSSKNPKNPSIVSHSSSPAEPQENFQPLQNPPPSSSGSSPGKNLLRASRIHSPSSSSSQGPSKPSASGRNVPQNLENPSPSSSRSESLNPSSIPSPSLVSSQDRLKLSSWGLPLTILLKYHSRGLQSMFPWQVACLSTPNILSNSKNLVYSAPTSAGKTLVSEILVIKTVIERRKKVIFILPFVSVVREKMYYFQDLLSDSGVRVEGFMGGVQPPGGFSSTDVAIATIEKANSLINQMMEAGGLVDLGAVVIDELHLLGDPFRGYLLELLLTKLKYMSLKEENVQIQLIGMSATLPNLDVLAKWLDAELFKTDFRPVPLKELCKIGVTLYDDRLAPQKSLTPRADLPQDPDDIIALCLETLADGHSVLIFCPTKNWCETLARQISSSFSHLGRADTAVGRSLRSQLNTEAIMDTLEQLKRSPCGLDGVLRSTVSFGVAYHHAGLTLDERDVIEGAFRSGALRILTATSTLSSGVNLPARRVIIRTIMFHGRPIDTLTYKQMIGRAGRMGKDTAGESILICKPNEQPALKNLLKSSLQPIESCLQGPGPLVRSLLEAVASEVAYTLDDILLYTRCTLLSFTKLPEEVETSTKSAVDFLVENELLLPQISKSGDRRWVATQLGKACLAASVPPKDGLFLFEELQKARKCFVLDTELHVIYLVTPINSSSLIGQIDWYIFLNIWRDISDSERRVGQLVGVSETFILRATTGNVRQGKTLDVHKRFYTALALHDLVREVPLNAVCRKYSCCRGVIQSLQQTAATFAGMVTQFCKKLGWNCVELLVSQFQARLQFGVCRELLDLLRLPSLNGLRARSLFKEGITTVAELAAADELDVERALHKALPFESERDQLGEDGVDAERRRQMRTIFVTGRDGLTPREAAVLIVKEARVMVQHELGVEDVHWGKRSGSGSGVQSSSGSLCTIDDGDVVVRVGSGLESLSSSERGFNGRGDVSEGNRTAGLPGRAEAGGNDVREPEKNDVQSPGGVISIKKTTDDEKLVEVSAESSRPPVEPSKTPRASLLRTSLAKSSTSRSPSLFGDSLGLDTEEYGILEQNVIDLDNSVFSEVELSSFNLPGTSGNRSNNRTDEFVRPEAPQSRPASVAEENRSKSLVWDEDSWNNTNAVLERLKKLRTPPKSQKGKLVSKGKSSLEKVKKTSKRKLRSPGVEKSPIINVISYSSPGGLSTGSNRSEDDIIVASQSADRTGSAMRTRTRMKLESMRIRTQRTATKTQATIPKVLVRQPIADLKTFVCEDCSTESIIVNSDDETQRKMNPSRAKTVLKTQKDQKVREKLKRPDFEDLEIVNIREKAKFSEFKEKLASKSEISVALACETYLKDTITIGTKIIGASSLQEPGKRSRRVETCVHNDKRLCGVAMSWGKSVYFLSFENSEANRVPMKERMALLTELLGSRLVVRCFSTKETYRTLFRCCGIAPSCRFLDPRVADWLLNPDSPEKTFTNLVHEHLPEGLGLLHRLGPLSGPSGPGLNVKSSTPSDLRASTEALLTFWMQQGLSKKLEKISTRLPRTFQELEMPTVVLLSRMELTGLGVNLQALQELSSVIQDELSSIESKAYALVGKKFNFSSSKSVAGVLGMDTTKKVCTNKAVLEASAHPIAKLVATWRKLSSTHSKMICPLLNLAEKSSRIHGTCVTHTATGRVSMHEPNLQNVPRDFDSADSSFVVSVRMAFVSNVGNVIVSADYCQLELRILAHFSGEKKLLEVLRKPGDVFRNIAARWYNEDEAKVDDGMRQRTKQLCYGMIYGMGTRSLAETLQVDEAEAKVFVETFMRSYPGVRAWLAEVVEEARRDGFVETLMGRRRALPALRSDAPGERGQAERQAVNTKVQGSAADLAKKAMVDVDARMAREFEGGFVMPQMPVRRKLRSSRDGGPKGGFLVLQLHDELIYEVSQRDLGRVVRIIREGMEGVAGVGLKVPLPVRVKVGTAWGNLEEYQGV
ncbi:DNA polymerase theta [Diachasma alloeum]|uniref:DNA polymerase theta n=1 Tax=Diachasma alloeum TaxID=454923 RepID=UPI000738386F|nr:DNA polymerase theta [Diachasma alloeum]